MELEKEIVSLYKSVFSIVDGRVKMFDLFIAPEWIDLGYDNVEQLFVYNNRLYLLIAGSVYEMDDKYSLNLFEYYKPFSSFLNGDKLSAMTVDGEEVVFDEVERCWKHSGGAGVELAVIPVYNRAVAIVPAKRGVVSKVYDVPVRKPSKVFGFLRDAAAVGVTYSVSAGENIISGVKSLVDMFLEDKPAPLIDEPALVREMVDKKVRDDNVDVITAVKELFGEKKPEATYDDDLATNVDYSFRELFERNDKI